MKNKYLLFIVVLVFFIQNLNAQDIDVFKRDLNDHFVMPQIVDSMSFGEFKTLSTNIRLMDAMEAVVVPGIIHFKVNDKVTAWSLVGTRLVGYGGLIYVNFHKDGLWSDVFNYQALNSEESKTDYYIVLASIGLVAGSYLYDWIHGRSLLDKKQQIIRFKYAVKLVPEIRTSYIQSSKAHPELSLRVDF